ncbi:MAG: tRNA uridine-5-carboxymethylaminomethyl(34) synthesis GTPase MnmE [Clostridia bacterium]|nr:tRNA uridine-5-carboxymethylaminomethyl(34) synthesis GTPase MnmE [Clostridia bacterium]
MADTICAIATPVGNGGVAVIRVSGDNAVRIVSKIFDKWKSAEPKPRYATFGKISFDGVSDDILALYFPAPHSFTGENVVELQLHGGYYLSNKVVNKLISLGARLADRGEFSRRAVINGKMDLSQAEGIIDIINADSEASLKAGAVLLRGGMKEKIENLQNELTELMCEINVALDYPEHDIEYITTQKVMETCGQIETEISKVLSTAKLGRQVKNGVKVALAGNPNVGKSSLLNALVGFDRAIVTDIAGTTRDTIEASFEYGGVKFDVVDTAGLRETSDVVESVGIERAEREIENADLVIMVVNCDTDKVKINNKNTVIIQNKSDLKNKLTIKTDLSVSAKNNENIEKLKALIFEKTIDKELFSNELILTNERHIDCLTKAKNSLSEIAQASKNDTLDCIAVLVMDAWNSLGEITGTTANERIIDEIFARFCLGK